MRAVMVAVGVLSTSVCAAAETIGPWNVRAPDSTELVAMGPNLGWYSFSRTPGLLTIDEAFSAPAPIDYAGYANGGAGTTLQMHFNTPLVNQPGPDLVVFDARFELNSYEVRVGNDGFAAAAIVTASDLQPTGASHDYYYGPWPVDCPDIAVYAAGVDLSVIGVPSGGFVSDVQLVLTALGSDPLGVGAVMAAPAPCLGDLNGDGQVDLADFATLQWHFGEDNGALPADGDLNGDESVSMADFGLLVVAWGPCP